MKTSTVGFTHSFRFYYLMPFVSWILFYAGISSAQDAQRVSNLALSIHDSEGCYIKQGDYVMLCTSDLDIEFTATIVPGTRTVKLNGFIVQNPNNLSVIAHTWLFGDSNRQFSDGDSFPLNHTYSEDGTYEICFSIFDRMGCSKKICKDITICSESEISVDFEYASVSPLTYEFSGFITSNPNNLGIITWLWNFEDGTIMTGPVVTHTLNDENEVVCLVVADETNCQRRICTDLEGNTVATSEKEDTRAYPFIVAPNPVKDELNISFHNPVANNQAALVMTNSMGQVVRTTRLEKGQKQARFSTSNLSPGIHSISYAIKGEITQTERVLKVE